MVNGRFMAVPFERMKDPATGRPRVRLVDVNSDRYRIARSFMLRLKRDDFSRAGELARFAETTQLTPEAFRREFFHLVKDEPEVAVDIGLALAETATPGGPAEGGDGQEGGTPVS